MASINGRVIKMLKALTIVMKSRGDKNRASAYQKAMSSVASHKEQIREPNELMKLDKVGSKIVEKTKVYLKTGTLPILEEAKKDPKIMFCNIYGVGPKKAKELVDKNKIKNIEELRSRQELLNDTQKKGLKYFEVLQERIPKREIDVFDENLRYIIGEMKLKTLHHKIMGSWRRGHKDSGDIDVLFTDEKDKGENFKRIIEMLKRLGIILETLSEGDTKSLTICLVNKKIKKPRRVDFMYCPPEEFAFSALYFTGSAEFNVAMRSQVQEKGLTLNEHGVYEYHNRVKGERILVPKIKSRIMGEDPERPIFEYLGYEYRHPSDRRSGADLIVCKSSARKTKDSVISLSKKGKTILENKTEEELSAMYDLASKAYYNDAPIISDGVFDILKEYIEEKFPNSPVLLKVGSDLPSATERITKLPTPMPSMNKIKSDTNALENWCKNYPGQVVYSSKLDGVSGMLRLVQGETPKLYSRGNGMEGQDISHLLSIFKGEKVSQTLQSLLKTHSAKTKGTLMIRGEFIMKKSDFKKYSDEASNPRNLVSGLINRKEYDAKSKRQLRDMDFVAYEVIEPVMKPSEQMKFLSSMGLRTVFNGIFPEGPDNGNLSEILKERRSNDEYEIDGIIVSHDKIYSREEHEVINPKHSFAYKMVLSDQIMEAKVVDVLWEPSAQGYIKPRVRIEPTMINGVKIEYATAHNAAFIRDNKIGVGAVLEIIRSGDVIPKIKSVITPAEHTKMYEGDYVWTSTNVDIVLSNIKTNRTVQEKAIVLFFKRIGVPGLARGNVSRIMDAGYDTLAKILAMKEKDYLKVTGFKDKKAKKTYENIRQGIEDSEVIDFISATGVFGRGMGTSRIAVIMENFPHIFSEEKSQEENIRRISSLPGFAEKTAKGFVEHLKSFKEFVKVSKLEEYLTKKFKVFHGEKTEKKEPKNEKESPKPLSGKVIIFSGFRSKALKGIIVENGGIVEDKMNKKINMVITKDGKETTKTKTAKKRNVEIVTFEEFSAKFK